MSETACVRGCKIRGEHKTGCPGEDCWGCLPRRATDGLLCTACHCSLLRDLTAAPHLVEHLRTIERGQGESESVRGTREPPAPLSVAAASAADDLHAMLASWVLLIVEEHPGRLTGPSLAGSRVTEATARRVSADPWSVQCATCGRWSVTSRRQAIAEAGAHYDTTGHVVTVAMLPDELLWSEASYITPSVAGAHDPAATRSLTSWLSRQVSWVEEQPWCAEMVREVTSTVATLLARYPEAERARAIPDLPCPKCQRLTLTYYPPEPVPAWSGQAPQIVVQCAHHACSVRVPESEWGLTIRRYLDEVGDKTPPPHERRHLGRSTAGYGGRP